MLKKMTSNDSMTTSVENKERKGILGAFVSMPLSVKLFLLVIIALIPRIMAFLQPQIITLDGTLYIKMAKLFSEGQYGGTPGSYFNFYPFLIYLVQKLVGDWELSGQLISIALGTLTVIPVFMLGRSLYNEKIGWLSAIFYSTLPNLLKFDSQVIRDPTLWFFILFTMWFVWEGDKKNKPIFFVLASISAGLGALTRVEGFVLWGVLILYTGYRKLAEISFKRKALNLSVFIFLFPLLLSLTLFSFKKDSSEMAFGEMSSFSLKFISSHARTVLQPRDPIETMGERTYYSLPVIAQDSLELASRHRITLAISEVIYKFIKSANLLILLVILGFWKRKTEGFAPSDKYVLFIFSALFLMSVLYARQIYYFSTRHGLTLVLPTLFFTGYGLNFMVETTSRGFNRYLPGWTRAKKYLPHIITVFLVVLFLVQGFSGKGREKVIIKEAGIWLKEKGFQGSLIMGPKKYLRLAFYGDGRFVEMPDSWDKAVETVQREKVQLIVIDPSTIDQDCPGFLFDRTGVDLFRLEAFKGGKQQMQIYEVRIWSAEKTEQIK